MTLADIRKNFALTHDEFMAVHGVEPGRRNANVRYQKLDNLTRVTLREGLHFYFRGARLTMVYVSEGPLATALWREFKSTSAASAKETVVPSRAGKTSNQLLFAEKGITVSVHGDEVDFLEIFNAVPLAQYLADIYEQPGPFIR